MSSAARNNGNVAVLLGMDGYDNHFKNEDDYEKRLELPKKKDQNKVADDPA